MTVVIESRYDHCMQANDDSAETAPTRQRSPARALMVRSAATLIRERGIHGVGLREVVAHSGGPRGSLGRYFPGGKTQLMTEAIDIVSAVTFRAMSLIPGWLIVSVLGSSESSIHS